MNRKEIIEEILETKLSVEEYKALKKEQFRFWQSPGRYIKESTNLDRTWENNRVCFLAESNRLAYRIS